MRGLAAITGAFLLASSPATAGPANASSTILNSVFDRAIADTKTAMMADPSAALAMARRAETIAHGPPDTASARQEVATAKWLEGEALTRVNKPDRALLVIGQAYTLAASVGPGGKLLADILYARATAETATGDVRSSLDDHQRAYNLYVRLGDARGEAKALLGIGTIYSEGGDLDRAVHYHSLVSDTYQGDPAINLSSFNNRGETLKKLGRFREAQADYRRALVAANQMRSDLLRARILTNMATAQLLGGSPDSASRSAAAALALTGSSEAAGWRPFVWGVMAQIALARGRLDQARTLIERTFAGVDLASSPPPFRDFHETAYEIYQRLGRFEPALHHHVAFKRLDDDARKLTASVSAALTSARFDFASQDLRIVRLKAERAQKTSELIRAGARLRTIVLTTLLAAGGALLAVLSLAFLSIRRSRNKERHANAELSVANSSLEKALRVKTEFLATTSHEIRTPLNGILGMTQVLLSDRGLGAEVRDRIKVVHGAGETMRALVDDILDIAKIESGKVSVDKMPMNLRGMLTESARLWRDQAEAKGLSFTVDAVNAPDWICEDEARLRQIIFNLLSNAMKFTDVGQVALSATVARDGDDENKLEIAVRDSGIGVALDQQALIFGSFHQADGGISRRFGGTGLGLSICRQLARAMGGEVTVTSQPGQGSTFTLQLPLEIAPRPREVGPAPDRTATGTADLADARLLLVGMNPLTGRLMRKVLEPVAGSVTVVDSDEEALAATASGSCSYHLLLDADAGRIEAGDAWSALQRLCAAVQMQGGMTTILFVPGDDVIDERLASLDVSQLLAKPIDGAALIAALRALYEGELALADPAVLSQAA